MSETNPNQVKGWAAILRRVAFVLVATLVLLEVGLRILFAISLSRGMIAITHTPDLQRLNVSDALLLWRLRPGVKDFPVRTHKVYENEVPLPSAFTVSTNSLGLRGAEEPASQPSFRVLAVGDSTTFGLGVNDAETWPAQLARLLQKEKPGAEVLNAGVTGYSVFQSLTYLRESGFALAPKVVVLTCGSNDFDTGGKLTQQQQQAFLERVRPASPHWVTFELIHKFYADSEDEAANVPNVPAAEFESLLRSTAEECSQRGIRLVLVIWPWQGQLDGSMTESPLNDYHGIIERVGRERALSVVNLRKRWTAAAMSGNYLDGVHVNAAGNADAASAIGDVLSTD